MLDFPQFRDQKVELYMFQSENLLGGRVMLNGDVLEIDQYANLPMIAGKEKVLGADSKVIVPPLSYCFLCSSRRD